MEAMPSPSARQALLFTAGGIPLALPLTAVRSIAPAGGAGGGDAAPISVARCLGRPRGAEAFDLLLEPAGRGTLRVDAMRGVGNLSRAEVFRLPARTVAVRPAPCTGAFLLDGTLH